MSRRLKLTLIVVPAVLALSIGSAVASSRWLVTSTHQIKPSVLKQLHGAQGPVGPAGAAGAQGPQGAPGTPTTLSDVQGSVAYCASGGGSCSDVEATATCPGSEIASGGAANVNTIEATVSTFVGGNVYIAVEDNQSPFAGTLSVTAVCASGPSFAAADTASIARTDASSLLARIR